MGIESDQVVYEYLSKVGDLAQQRQLPSGDRMRLVSELRDEIDRRRAKAPVDSPASVRRILDRIGTPDEIVAGAGGSGPAEAPRAAVPVQRDRDEPPRRGKGLGRLVPRPRPAERGAGKDAEPFAPFPADGDPAPPQLADGGEPGGGDWWLSGRRVPLTDSDSDSLPAGFVGGVEIPDLLRRPSAPPQRARPADEAVEPDEPVEQAPASEEAGQGTPRRRLRLRVPLPSGKWSNPLLLLAAGLLVAGAVLGNLFALLLGWAIAYASRRLSQAETKWAVVYLPGAALAAGAGWLWGRTQGRWGDPIVEGHMNEAIGQTWPWVVRGAAIASALFLVWRSQRPR
ncbi:hypothetical protein [Streptomyces geranii]|uniref:hypothetical protein n=1 Tax=Streptomyces geranii TaxID=2058923 RepID=UPI000D024E5C|nr:hypothetical protein [Streptomyces geranii]